MNESVDISQQQMERAALDALLHEVAPAVGGEVLEKLRHVSTATLATALFKRGLRNQMIQAVQPLAPLATNMVGIAFTLRYIPAREDLNPISVFDDAEHPQRKAIESCPPGAVLVIDSGLRDSAEIAALEIPAFHNRPSAPTNLTLHQAIDINVPIGCGDAPVFPGDVIVGDADGAIVIPAAMARDVAEEATRMTVYEDFVVDMVAAGHSIVGLYPMTDPAIRTRFEAWRKEKGR
jgi:regulator of RNase E activity RraA